MFSSYDQLIVDKQIFQSTFAHHKSAGEPRTSTSPRAAFETVCVMCSAVVPLPMRDLLQCERRQHLHDRVALRTITARPPISVTLLHSSSFRSCKTITFVSRPDHNLTVVSLLGPLSPTTVKLSPPHTIMSSILKPHLAHVRDTPDTLEYTVITSLSC